MRSGSTIASIGTSSSARCAGRQIMEDFEVWRRQPDAYLNPGMTGIFSLFLHRLRPIEELVDAGRRAD